VRSHRRHRSGKFLYITPISKRPELINQRACFGHWEADTVQFLPSLATVSITTMVERQTRFALVMKQPDKKTKTVMPVIKSALDRLPLAATQTVTFDQGSEFADFRLLERRRKYHRRRIKTYFCNPRSPWQKGGVENFNLRLRRFLPRDLDIRTMSQRKIGSIVVRMNQTPRKCLAYQTPAEAFDQRCRASN
jgi:IS30 family transposase